MSCLPRALGRNRTDTNNLHSCCTTSGRGRTGASGWTRTNTRPGKNRLLCIRATEAMPRRGVTLALARMSYSVVMPFAPCRCRRVELSFPDSESDVLPIERNPIVVGLSRLGSACPKTSRARRGFFLERAPRSRRLFQPSLRIGIPSRNHLLMLTDDRSHLFHTRRSALERPFDSRRRHRNGMKDLERFVKDCDSAD